MNLRRLDWTPHSTQEGPRVPPHFLFLMDQDLRSLWVLMDHPPGSMPLGARIGTIKLLFIRPLVGDGSNLDRCVPRFVPCVPSSRVGSNAGGSSPSFPHPSSEGLPPPCSRLEPILSTGAFVPSGGLKQPHTSATRRGGKSEEAGGQDWWLLEEA